MPNFSKYKIRPALTIFSAFLKEITMARSSANFLSPEPNGQGLNYAVWILTTFDLARAKIFHGKKLSSKMSANSDLFWEDHYSLIFSIL